METQNDKSFKDKLSKTSVEIDLLGQWDEIEAKLDKKENRRGLLYWWFGGVGMLIVVLLGWYILKQERTPTIDHILLQRSSQDIRQLEKSQTNLVEDQLDKTDDIDKIALGETLNMEATTPAQSQIKSQLEIQNQQDTRLESITLEDMKAINSVIDADTSSKTSIKRADRIETETFFRSC